MDFFSPTLHKLSEPQFKKGELGTFKVNFKGIVPSEFKSESGLNRFLYLYVLTMYCILEGREVEKLEPDLRKNYFDKTVFILKSGVLKYI